MDNNEFTYDDSPITWEEIEIKQTEKQLRELKHMLDMLEWQRRMICRFFMRSAYDFFQVGDIQEASDE